MSSGGVLALRAAAAGVPYRAGGRLPAAVQRRRGRARATDRFRRPLDELVASGRRGAAVSYFMREGMGAPRAFVGFLRVARPIWRNLEAVAQTLPYDSR
jgi:hypothetical protein